MAWLGEWLRGEERPVSRDPAPTSARTSPTTPRTPADRPDPAHPGQDFGLPESGPDSVATIPLRGGQFLLDLVIAGLVAAAFDFPTPTWLSLTVWAVLVAVPVAVIGRTPAMVLCGMRVARVDGVATVGLGWALARTVSLFFIVPGLVVDRDARGLQDRVSRTIVLRTR